ncbi:hypothetical protein SGPA1_21929 [Streptomyces misionensis JCM 4497]
MIASPAPRRTRNGGESAVTWATGPSARAHTCFRYLAGPALDQTCAGLPETEGPEFRKIVEPCPVRMVSAVVRHWTHAFSRSTLEGSHLSPFSRSRSPR